MLTPQGTATLGSLKEGDRVVSFYAHNSSLVGLREGLGVEVGTRPYDGNLYGVSVDQRESWSTDGHLWTVRLTADYPKKWCVYLMRRGAWWRVGMTKMRTTWGFGLKGRLMGEDGEEAWILSLHDSHCEARIHEQLVSVQYGVPQTHWRPTRLADQRMSQHIEAFYTHLDLNKLDEAANAALAAHYRHRRHPFVENNDTRSKFGARQSIQVRACNLLPGIMEIPVPTRGQSTQWQTIRHIDVQPYTGTVHSLGVDKHHHYIADGLVTPQLFLWLERRRSPSVLWPKQRHRFMGGQKD